MERKKLTKKELEFFVNLILKNRKESIEELKYLYESAKSSIIKESSGNNSSYPFNISEQGKVSMEGENLSLFISCKRHYLSNLNKALTRIDYGNYGICNKCGELISKEVLKAVPITTQCVECIIKRYNEKGCTSDERFLY